MIMAIKIIPTVLFPIYPTLSYYFSVQGENYFSTNQSIGYIPSSLSASSSGAGASSGASFSLTSLINWFNSPMLYNIQIIVNYTDQHNVLLSNTTLRRQCVTVCFGFVWNKDV